MLFPYRCSDLYLANHTWQMTCCLYIGRDLTPAQLALACADCKRQPLTFKYFLQLATHPSFMALRASSLQTCPAANDDYQTQVCTTSFMHIGSLNYAFNDSYCMLRCICILLFPRRKRDLQIGAIIHYRPLLVLPL